MIGKEDDRNIKNGENYTMENEKANKTFFKPTYLLCMAIDNFYAK